MEMISTIRQLLVENRKYFSEKVSEHNKSFKGYQFLHEKEAEVKKETGVLIFGKDLHTSIHAPPIVKEMLPALIEEHGYVKVMIEMIRQMKERDMIDGI